MSKRAVSDVAEVKGSHAIYVSQPKTVTAIVETGRQEPEDRRYLVTYRTTKVAFFSAD